MTRNDLYITNGKIVTENTSFFGGVVIKSGKISQLIIGNDEVDAVEKIDLKGRILLPGVIDEHAHFSELGRDWEGYVTGSRAAAAGGVTTVIDMPLNDIPPIINKENLQRKREITRDKSIVDYANLGGLVDNNIEDIHDLHKEGVVGFKAFMTFAPDFGKVNDGILFGGLELMKKLGSIIGVHAENESLNNFLRERFIMEGRRDWGVWPESRPPEGEIEAIRRAIHWAKATGGNLLIHHVSIADGVEAVAKAKLQGVNVFVETCAHYLFFDVEDYLSVGPELRCAPPLRPRIEVEKLWDCIHLGLLDSIASDHSPCPPEMQEKGFANIWDAFGGITGIQVLLPAMITEGVHKRGLSWSQLVRLLSTNPAKIFGIYPKKGTISPGSDADFTVVDPNKEWTLVAEDLHSRHKHSAYIGRSFKGYVDCTIVRGKVVYEDRRFKVNPGYGKLVCRI